MKDPIEIIAELAWKLTAERERNTSLRAENKQLAAAVRWWMDTVHESKGLAGWHLNGDIALWSEFDEAIQEHEALLSEGKQS